MLKARISNDTGFYFADDFFLPERLNNYLFECHYLNNCNVKYLLKLVS